MRGHPDQRVGLPRVGSDLHHVVGQPLAVVQATLADRTKCERVREDEGKEREACPLGVLDLPGERFVGFDPVAGPAREHVQPRGRHRRERRIVDALRNLERLATERQHAVEIEDIGLHRRQHVDGADEHGVVAHSTRHRDRLADQPLPLIQRVAEEQLSGERCEQARALDGVTFANRVERHRAPP